MNNIAVKMNIHQIIEALTDLEAKGGHSVFFEYSGGMYMIKIYNGDAHTGKKIYHKIINPKREQSELDALAQLIDKLKNSVMVTVFQCYMREFVRGQKVGDWTKIKPIILFGENSRYSMLNDGSGYYLDDPENEVQYFVDLRQGSEL